MKLLLDENLSRRLVPFLQHSYPGTSQVVLLGLEAASDRAVWQMAKDQDYVIVTRDADFEELSFVLGQPPKIIWLKVKNQARATTLKILNDNQATIEDALIAQDLACVELTDVYIGATES